MIKVSIAVITYNHEAFIAQALESVLMQQTTFPVEIVLAEDCSTDRTRTIVQEYQHRYPDRIILLLHSQNIGPAANAIATYTRCQGEYIAFLEGDDYWTDPLKLQKQVDFLEAHRDFTFCAHRVYELYEATNPPTNSILQLPALKPYYTLDDIIREGHVFKVCSIVMRRDVLKSLPPWFSQSVCGDLMLYTLLASSGKVGFLDEAMAVYRIHSGGLAHRQSEVKVLEMAIGAYLLLGKHLQISQRLSFRETLSKLYFKMFETYVAQSNLRAVTAAFRAFGTAPLHARLPLFIRLGQVWLSWVEQRLRQLPSIIRIYGLRRVRSCCGVANYNRLKAKYHSVKNKIW